MTGVMSEAIRGMILRSSLIETVSIVCTLAMMISFTVLNYDLTYTHLNELNLPRIPSISSFTA